MLRKMGHFSSMLSLEMTYRRKCQISPAAPKFSGNRGQFTCLEKWTLAISNIGSKLTKFGDKFGLRGEARNVAKMGHFSSRLAFEIRPRRKCRISGISQNFGEIAAGLFVSEIIPFYR